MKKYIEVKYQVAGIHHWPDAPDTQLTEFLQFPHRHLFVIRARFSVNDSNRELEFFTVLDELKKTLKYLGFGDTYKIPVLNFGSGSCEMIAEGIYKNMPSNMKPVSVGVWEDDENGAIIEFD